MWKIFFPGNKFSDRYRHVGYSCLGVPKTWKPVVQQCIIDIEKLMWPRYLPFWLKRLIHYLGTGNSIVRVKYQWAFDLRSLITGGTLIQDIKDKYATLRIYGYFTDEMQDLIDEADEECQSICEYCGSKDGVQSNNQGWIRNLCKKCRDA